MNENEVLAATAGPHDVVHAPTGYVVAKKLSRRTAARLGKHLAKLSGVVLRAAAGDAAAIQELAIVVDATRHEVAAEEVQASQQQPEVARAASTGVADGAIASTGKSLAKINEATLAGEWVKEHGRVTNAEDRKKRRSSDDRGGPRWTIYFNVFGRDLVGEGETQNEAILKAILEDDEQRKAFMAHVLGKRAEILAAAPKLPQHAVYGFVDGALKTFQIGNYDQQGTFVPNDRYDEIVVTNDGHVVHVPTGFLVGNPRSHREASAIAWKMGGDMSLVLEAAQGSESAKKKLNDIAQIAIREQNIAEDRKDRAEAPWASHQEASIAEKVRAFVSGDKRPERVARETEEMRAACVKLATCVSGANEKLASDVPHDRREAKRIMGDGFNAIQKSDEAPHVDIDAFVSDFRSSVYRQEVDALAKDWREARVTVMRLRRLAAKTLMGDPSDVHAALAPINEILGVTAPPMGGEDTSVEEGEIPAEGKTLGYVNDKNKSALYVAHVPGQDGPGWSWVSSAKQARHLPPYWQRRFERDMKDIGREPRFAQQPPEPVAVPVAAIQNQDPEIVYDDTYAGPRWIYGLQNRPAGYGATPKGRIAGGDKQHPRFRHGIIQYPFELSPKDVSSYELTLVEQRPGSVFTVTDDVWDSLPDAKMSQIQDAGTEWAIRQNADRSSDYVSEGAYGSKREALRAALSDVTHVEKDAETGKAIEPVAALAPAVSIGRESIVATAPRTSGFRTTLGEYVPSAVDTPVTSSVVTEKLVELEIAATAGSEAAVAQADEIRAEATSAGVLVPSPAVIAEVANEIVEAKPPSDPAFADRELTPAHEEALRRHEMGDDGPRVLRKRMAELILVATRNLKDVRGAIEQAAYHDAMADQVVAELSAFTAWRKATGGRIGASEIGKRVPSQDLEATERARASESRGVAKERLEEAHAKLVDAHTCAEKARTFEEARWIKDFNKLNSAIPFQRKRALLELPNSKEALAQADDMRAYETARASFETTQQALRSGPTEEQKAAACAMIEQTTGRPALPVEEEPGPKYPAPPCDVPTPRAIAKLAHAVLVSGATDPSLKRYVAGHWGEAMAWELQRAVKELEEKSPRASNDPLYYALQAAERDIYARAHRDTMGKQGTQQVMDEGRSKASVGLEWLGLNDDEITAPGTPTMALDPAEKAPVAGVTNDNVAEELVALEIAKNSGSRTAAREAEGVRAMAEDRGIVVPSKVLIAEAASEVVGGEGATEASEAQLDAEADVMDAEIAKLDAEAAVGIAEATKIADEDDAQAASESESESGGKPKAGRADYEKRRLARIERLRDIGQRMTTEAGRMHARAKQMAEMIPLGQPIITGRGSRTAADINYRKRYRDLYSKSFQTQQEGERLIALADKAEKNRTISSDDPNAPERIREKIANIKKQHEIAKLVNKSLRAAGKKILPQIEKAKGELLTIKKDPPDVEALSVKAKTDYGGDLYKKAQELRDKHLAKMAPKIDAKHAEIDALRRAWATEAATHEADAFSALGLPDRDQLVRILLKGTEPDFAGRYGIPSFSLTSSTAEIRRLEKRLEDIASREIAAGVGPETLGNVEVREEDNRIQILFGERVPREIFEKMRSQGWRATPSLGDGAFTRMASPGIRDAARRIVQEIQGAADRTEQEIATYAASGYPGTLVRAGAIQRGIRVAGPWKKMERIGPFSGVFSPVQYTTTTKGKTHMRLEDDRILDLGENELMVADVQAAQKVTSPVVREEAVAVAVCPRCLDIEPGTPGGNPEEPHPGPFTENLCAACVTASAPMKQEVTEKLIELEVAKEAAETPEETKAIVAEADLVRATAEVAKLAPPSVAAIEEAAHEVERASVRGGLKQQVTEQLVVMEVARSTAKTPDQERAITAEMQEVREQAEEAKLAPPSHAAIEEAAREISSAGIVDHRMADEATGSNDKPREKRKGVGCYYNGKSCDMAYVEDPKKRFKIAAMRIVDNGAEGYVTDNDKIYFVGKNSRTSKLLSGEARDAALKTIEAIESGVVAKPAAPKDLRIYHLRKPSTSATGEPMAPGFWISDGGGLINFAGPFESAEDAEAKAAQEGWTVTRHEIQRIAMVPGETFRVIAQLPLWVKPTELLVRAPSADKLREMRQGDVLAYLNDGIWRLAAEGHPAAHADDMTAIERMPIAADLSKPEEPSPKRAGGADLAGLSLEAAALRKTAKDLAKKVTNGGLHRHATPKDLKSVAAALLEAADLCAHGTPAEVAGAFKRAQDLNTAIQPGTSPLYHRLGLLILQAQRLPESAGSSVPGAPAMAPAIAAEGVAQALVELKVEEMKAKAEGDAAGARKAADEAKSVRADALTLGVEAPAAADVAEVAKSNVQTHAEILARGMGQENAERLASLLRSGKEVEVRADDNVFAIVPRAFAGIFSQFAPRPHGMARVPKMPGWRTMSRDDLVDWLLMCSLVEPARSNAGAAEGSEANIVSGGVQGHGPGAGGAQPPSVTPVSHDAVATIGHLVDLHVAHDAGSATASSEIAEARAEADAKGIALPTKAEIQALARTKAESLRKAYVAEESKAKAKAEPTGDLASSIAPGMYVSDDVTGAKMRLPRGPVFPHKCVGDAMCHDISHKRIHTLAKHLAHIAGVATTPAQAESETLIGLLAELAEARRDAAGRLREAQSLEGKAQRAREHVLKQAEHATTKDKRAVARAAAIETSAMPEAAKEEAIAAIVAEKVAEIAQIDPETYHNATVGAEEAIVATHAAEAAIAHVKRLEAEVQSEQDAIEANLNKLRGKLVEKQREQHDKRKKSLREKIAETIKDTIDDVRRAKEEVPSKKDDLTESKQRLVGKESDLESASRQVAKIASKQNKEQLERAKNAYDNARKHVANCERWLSEAVASGPAAKKKLDRALEARRILGTPEAEAYLKRIDEISEACDRSILRGDADEDSRARPISREEAKVWNDTEDPIEMLLFLAKHVHGDVPEGQLGLGLFDARPARATPPAAVATSVQAGALNPAGEIKEAIAQQALKAVALGAPESAIHEAEVKIANIEASERSAQPLNASTFEGVAVPIGWRVWESDGRVNVQLPGRPLDNSPEAAFSDYLNHHGFNWWKSTKTWSRRTGAPTQDAAAHALRAYWKATGGEPGASEHAAQTVTANATSGTPLTQAQAAQRLMATFKALGAGVTLREPSAGRREWEVEAYTSNVTGHLKTETSIDLGRFAIKIAGGAGTSAVRADLREQKTLARDLLDRAMNGIHVLSSDEEKTGAQGTPEAATVAPMLARTSTKSAIEALPAGTVLAPKVAAERIHKALRGVYSSEEVVENKPGLNKSKEPVYYVEITTHGTRYKKPFEESVGRVIVRHAGGVGLDAVAFGAFKLHGPQARMAVERAMAGVTVMPNNESALVTAPSARSESAPAVVATNVTEKLISLALAEQSGSREAAVEANTIRDMAESRGAVVPSRAMIVDAAQEMASLSRPEATTMTFPRGARVYLDGKDGVPVYVIGAFPKGTTSYSFPHYVILVDGKKLPDGSFDKYAGERTVVAMNRIGAKLATGASTPTRLEQAVASVGAHPMVLCVARALGEAHESLELDEVYAACKREAGMIEGLPKTWTKSDVGRALASMVPHYAQQDTDHRWRAKSADFPDESAGRPDVLLDWKESPGSDIQAPLSGAGPYMISHRKNEHNVSYRPIGEHHHVGTYTTPEAAKQGAEEHAKKLPAGLLAKQTEALAEDAKDLAQQIQNRREADSKNESTVPPTHSNLVVHAVKALLSKRSMPYSKTAHQGVTHKGERTHWHDALERFIEMNTGGAGAVTYPEDYKPVAIAIVPRDMFARVRGALETVYQGKVGLITREAVSKLAPEAIKAIPIVKHDAGTAVGPDANRIASFKASLQSGARAITFRRFADRIATRGQEHGGQIVELHPGGFPFFAADADDMLQSAEMLGWIKRVGKRDMNTSQAAFNGLQYSKSSVPDSPSFFNFQMGPDAAGFRAYLAAAPPPGMPKEPPATPVSAIPHSKTHREMTEVSAYDGSHAAKDLLANHVPQRQVHYLQASDKGEAEATAWAGEWMEAFPPKGEAARVTIIRRTKSGDSRTVVRVIAVKKDNGWIWHVEGDAPKETKTSEKPTRERLQVIERFREEPEALDATKLIKPEAVRHTNLVEPKVWYFKKNKMWLVETHHASEQGAVATGEKLYRSLYGKSVLASQDPHLCDMALLVTYRGGVVEVKSSKAQKQDRYKTVEKPADLGENEAILKTPNGPKRVRVLARRADILVHESLGENHAPNQAFTVSYEPVGLAIGRFATQKLAEARAELLAHPNMHALLERAVKGDDAAGKKLVAHLAKAEAPFFTPAEWKNFIRFILPLLSEQTGAQWKVSVEKRHARNTTSGREVAYEAKLHADDKQGILDIISTREEVAGSDPRYGVSIAITAKTSVVFNESADLESLDSARIWFTQRKLPRI